MKAKHKIRILNITISLFIPLLFLLIAVNCLNEYTKGGENGVNYAVFAEDKIEIIDKPIYNIYSSNGVSTPKQKVEINSASDFITLYNNYINSLFESKRLYITVSTMVKAVGTAVGVSVTTNYICQDTFGFTEDGVYYKEYYTCEIPQEDGTTYGYSPYNYELHLYYEDGTEETWSNTSTYLEKVDGQYVLKNDKKNLNYSKKQTESYLPLPFLVSEETVYDFSMVKNSFSYDIELFLNAEGRRHSNVSDTILYYDYFKLNFTVSQYGQILSFNRMCSFYTHGKKGPLSADIDMIRSATINIYEKKQVITDEIQ